VTVDWNLVVGVLGLAVSTAVTFIVFGLGRRLDFRQRLARRDVLRREVHEILRDAPPQQLPEVLIVNASRYERDYDGDNRLTMRGWVQQRAEMLGVRHNGVEFVSGIVNTWQADDGRLTLRPTSTQGPNVLEVGFVPFEYIEHIDPIGDEYRNTPIFFVQFKGHGREPYAHHSYAEADGAALYSGGREYHRPLDELGLSRPSWFRGQWRFARRWWRARAMDRGVRKRPQPR